MKNLINTALMALVLLAYGCNDTGNNGNKGIRGVIENGGGEDVVLIGYNAGMPDTISKAKIKNDGSFYLPVDAKRLNFYTLQIGQYKPMVLAIDSMSKVQISGKLESIEQDYHVTGSPDSEAIRDYFVAATKYERSLDSLMKAMQASANTGDRDLRGTLALKYRDMQEEYKRYKRDMIDKDPANAVNFSILQSMNIREDFEQFKKVKDGLAPRMQGNYFFDNLAEMIGQQEQLSRRESALNAGNEAPEISLPNPDGEMVNLSSLRGKYVLIDFWASWCKPCRIENPHVVKLYNKYKDKNFEIYGVSLDRDRDKWLEAIKADQLKWIHVSDLKYWQSAGAQLYNVQSIPYTVLIDPDGKIVSTKLRAAELERKLAEIYGV